MKNYLGINTKMFTFTSKLEMEPVNVGNFCGELTDVLNPCGTFTISVSNMDYPSVKIRVPEDYGVQFETFLDRWFGKGTSDKWRASVLEDDDDDEN